MGFQPKQASHHPEVRLVVFSLAGEEFALPLAQIQEIIRPLHLRQIPNDTGHLEGVTTLRGHVLPVISLRKELGISVDESQGGRIIVARGKDRRLVGLLVDSASEVATLQAEAFESLPSAAKRDKYGRLVRAIAKMGEGDRVLFVLDVDTVLADAGKESPRRPSTGKGRVAAERERRPKQALAG